MFIHKAAQVHCTGGTGHRTGAASLTNCRVHSRHTANGRGPVGHTEFLVLIGDGTVGANSFAGRATVAHLLVGMGYAGVPLQLILGKQADHLGGGGACLRNGFGNILGTLAGAGKEHASRGAFHRTKLGMGLGINLTQISRVTKTEIKLSDGTAIPLPRGAYDGINRALINMR